MLPPQQHQEDERMHRSTVLWRQDISLGAGSGYVHGAGTRPRFLRHPLRVRTLYTPPDDLCNVPIPNPNVLGLEQGGPSKGHEAGIFATAF